MGLFMMSNPPCFIANFRESTIYLSWPETCL